MSDQQTDKLVPAYGAFKSVKAFVGQLAKTVFPSAIDRDMMKGMSGATQSEVSSAFRFLRCIDDKGHTTAKLKKLVDAFGKDSWPVVLRETLAAAYEPVIGGLDLKNGSGQQLNEAFRKATNAQGFMLNRHVRFFLAAMRDAGVEMSPHFKVPKAPPRKRSPPPATDVGDQQNVNGKLSDGESKHVSATPTDMIDIPVPMGSQMGFIRIAKSITMEHVPLIEAALGMVKAMAEINSSNTK